MIAETTAEPTGAELRDEALDGLEKRHPAIVRRCQRIVVRIVIDGGTATADDLEHVDSGKRRRGFLGAVFRNLHKLGVIESCGYQTSKIPRNHARPLGVWRCANVERARKWLDDNPEIDE